MNLNTLLFPPRFRKFFFYSRFQDCSRLRPFEPFLDPPIGSLVHRPQQDIGYTTSPSPSVSPSLHALRATHEWSELSRSCIRAVGCQQRPGSAVFPYGTTAIGGAIPLSPQSVLRRAVQLPLTTPDLAL